MTLSIEMKYKKKHKNHINNIKVFNKIKWYFLDTFANNK
jgi:hypothetical protein